MQAPPFACGREDDTAEPGQREDGVCGHTGSAAFCRRRPGPGKNQPVKQMISGQDQSLGTAPLLVTAETESRGDHGLESAASVPTPSCSVPSARAITQPATKPGSDRQWGEQSTPAIAGLNDGSSRGPATVPVLSAGDVEAEDLRLAVGVDPGGEPTFRKPSWRLQAGVVTASCGKAAPWTPP